jgi:hypothetical protein
VPHQYNEGLNDGITIYPRANIVLPERYLFPPSWMQPTKDGLVVQSKPWVNPAVYDTLKGDVSDAFRRWADEANIEEMHKRSPELVDNLDVIGQAIEMSEMVIMGNRVAYLKAKLLASYAINALLAALLILAYYVNR